MSTANEIKLFSGTGTPRLAHAVAEQLGTGITHGTVSQFPDGETRINIEESVRGAVCFVIQSTSSPVNHNLMELLVMADALRRASAWRINAVIPRSEERRVGQGRRARGTRSRSARSQL